MNIFNIAYTRNNVFACLGERPCIVTVRAGSMYLLTASSQQGIDCRFFKKTKAQWLERGLSVRTSVYNKHFKYSSSCLIVKPNVRGEIKINT
jgi:hypothetical protein